MSESAGQLKILIVDDNPVNCKVLIGSLEPYEQYKLLVAHNGVKAISIAEKALPNLILLDINMPEMNGFEVCEHLKKTPETQDIPIIFLSALDDVESKIKGFTLGAVDYVTKPFHKEEVIKRVETQIKIQQLNQSLNKQNQALANKNEELTRLLNEISQMQLELEESHQEITSSINYALRIQNAILPTPSSINNYVQDSFILYKPRDIVSGDFYWFGSVGDKMVAAAIDCTGHGVPGALMSVIGYTQIHSIIYETGIISPKGILTELDARIRGILNQDNKSGSQDGMDMSIVIYNEKTQTLEFSGANNPLIYLREGAVNEIKGVPYPIGGTILETKEYQTETIQVKPGDRYYLFSDGFQDQFGGENGKKFTRRRMKEHLEATAHLPLSEQKTQLENTLNEWKEGFEQTDDILLFCVQFS